MTSSETMKEIKIVKDRINAVERKLDNYFNELHEGNAANIDYIAMMADVELPEKEEEVDAQ